MTIKLKVLEPRQTHIDQIEIPVEVWDTTDAPEAPHIMHSYHYSLYEANRPDFVAIAVTRAQADAPTMLATRNKVSELKLLTGTILDIPPL